MIENFAKEIGAEIGISLPISKKPYLISDNLSSMYLISDRVIGTSGRKVNPLLYFAIGISGADTAHCWNERIRICNFH